MFWQLQKSSLSLLQLVEDDVACCVSLLPVFTMLYVAINQCDCCCLWHFLSRLCVCQIFPAYVWIMATQSRLVRGGKIQAKFANFRKAANSWQTSKVMRDDTSWNYCEMNTHFDVSLINHLWPRIRGCQRLLRMLLRSPLFFYCSRWHDEKCRPF